MNINLKNKIAIVTGASRGIGKKISILLEKHHATIIGTSSTSKGVDKINKFLKKKKSKGFLLNLNDDISIKNFFLNVNKNFDSIDILINNAAIIQDKFIINMKIKEWENVIHTNLTSIFIMVKNVLFNMIKKKYGRIVTIGSVIANIGNKGQSNYAASKSGIIGFNKCLAKEIAKYNITANIVSPGFIKTKLIKNIPILNKKKILQNIPMEKIGNKNDIAYSVLFLTSKYASYITGENIHINGGLNMI
ncbi:SDR family oxidoreductase [Buchnera aphidicola (Taiwanaphis decaspermi)]|uniref:SDR family oxidoreductase n=1 Tax=Buchnera aphidicola TaxID=9 RepID=UPI0031B88611